VHQVGVSSPLITVTFLTEMYIPQTDWNRGTYRELKALLNELPEHYLDQTATVMLSDSDEYTDIRSIGWTGPACNVLDSDHFFLSINA